MTNEDILHKGLDIKHAMNIEGNIENGFPFHPDGDIDVAPVMEPRQAWIKTFVKRLGSGTVTIVIYTEKKAYKPGEGIQVIVEAINRSTCSLMLKYILQRTQSRISPGKRITAVCPIAEKDAKHVRAYSRKMMLDVITVPRGSPPTISMGSPIELHYELKVCVDMTGSNSAYLSWPIVVRPSSLHSAKRHQQSLKALTLRDVLHPNPNQQMQRPRKRPRKANSIDSPPRF
ncbi:uncharacterized protein LOC119127673 isoform X2 [Syngnathus acus]|uniref:uncharacterized protein LOC119127673 isoform X2 n=1 Tax=Syngnathus acus TaxID=161584 RepID=UPI001885EC0F|nr:uncharacterized protein LOC119127673 isoform X2 [Syngnathus acus]XP_037115590.1 uncharacterized protein LOC119127673 isoform X2 [Syngnathus acus]